MPPRVEALGQGAPLQTSPRVNCQRTDRTINVERSGYNGSIESLRGVAALMVLLYHVVALLRIPAPSSLDFISRHFGLGVPLFYTFSGFVLAYGYADKLNGVAEIRRFYIRRLFRSNRSNHDVIDRRVRCRIDPARPEWTRS
jgi:hypothetical protein